MTSMESRLALNALAVRIDECGGRMQDLYLGAHLALNLIHNHAGLTADEFTALLDSKIGREFAA